MSVPSDSEYQRLRDVRHDARTKVVVCAELLVEAIDEGRPADARDISMRHLRAAVEAQRAAAAAFSAATDARIAART